MVEHITRSEARSAVDREGIEQHVLAYTYNMMMAHYVIQPGVESPYHDHPHEQIGYVIGGEAVQIVDNEEYTLTPGTSYRLDPGERHAMHSVGDDPLELIDVFHPVREDYLPE